ncbi:MAG TPA: VWA domain-containing protein, partial [Thermoanaerobaculia bacterium]|nr:VWA domain-containing protein [Thermoanaerobaculia bacterium]
LLHLSRRRTREAVPFPSLMFIAQVPYRSVRRRRLRDRLLLLLRCLAIALLAMAFARPLLRAAPETARDTRRDVVLLVDTSFSMGYGDHMERAKDAANDLLSGLQPGDRAAVVSFAESATAQGAFSGDAVVLGQQVATLEPGPGRTRYSTAFKTARSLLLDSSAANREVVLIGDLQRGDFGENEDARLPPGVGVTIVDVGEGGKALSNLAITEVSLDRRPIDNASEAREEIEVSARVLRRGPVGDDGPAVEAELWIDGRQVGRREAELEADGSANLAFEPVVLPSDVYSRGEVRISGDLLEADNRFRFTVSPGDSIPVLILDGGPGGRSPYVAGALATGTRPRFRLDRTSANSVRADEIQRARVIVIDDALSRLTADARSALIDAVERGAGALVLLGRSESGGLPAWGLDGDEPLRQELSGRSLASIDYDHPIFSPFAAARSGDLSGARFFRYRGLSELPSRDRDKAADSSREAAAGDAANREGERVGGDASVVARFDDGSAALIERRVGRGRVAIWASTLDAEWGDLVLQPVFVPWIDRTMQHLAGFEPDRPFYRVGQVARLDLGERQGEEWLVVDPAEKRTTVPAERELLLPVRADGFYEVRPVEGNAQRALVVAANLDPVESDLTRLDAVELRLSLSQESVTVETAAESGEDRAAVERQRIWWYVLLGALLLLAIEGWLANRKGRRVPRMERAENWNADGLTAGRPST